MDRNEADLRRAIAELHLTPREVVICNRTQAAVVVGRAKQAFVGSSDPRWWWASLSKPAVAVDYPAGEAFRHLLEFVPQGEERCWLVVENDEDGPWHVLDTAVEAIPGIIAECSPFEYYLIGKEFNWLIAENHHKQLIVVTDARPRSDS